jgi:transcriptional regulator with GAF, ATPase, and Fis domain
VLIEGESGVGKELVAHVIHARSPRRDGPLVKVNCASIPHELFESEFFGHVKGAFTGAHRDRVGRFQLADGGTIFLDEVGEIPLDLQSKLLRVLQESEYERVGDEHTHTVDVRVVAATNRDLEKAVADSRFREDLFYRLSVFPIEVPPLRARGDDVLQIASHFLERTCQEFGHRPLTFSKQQAALLKRYDWPGNVRELKNAMERGLSRLPASGGRLSPEHLGIDTLGAGGALPWPAPGDKRSLLEMRDQLIGAWERNYLEQLLERCGGNVSRAAREGGIERVYLHRLLKRHNLGGRSRNEPR